MRAGGAKAEHHQKLVTKGLPRARKLENFDFVDAFVALYEGLLKEKGELGKINWPCLIAGKGMRSLACNAESMSSLLTLQSPLLPATC